MAVYTYHSVEWQRHPWLRLPGLVGKRTASVTWGDNSVSSCRSAVEQQVLALVRVRLLWHFPYLQWIQGVLDGVRRGPVGPPELAAPSVTRNISRKTIEKAAGVMNLLGLRRVRPRCRFRNRGADRLSESGMRWMRGGARWRTRPPGGRRGSRQSCLATGDAVILHCHWLSLAAAP
jgi:hypothetical protein